MTRRLSSLLLASLVALLAPRAEAMHSPGEGRKTSAHDFSLAVRRLVLPNGLVVLLAPDPTASSVLLWMTFRAGTVYEPAKRSGLAHLVEHIMMSGPTRETGYAALLEQRRARYLNATTDFESLRFETVVPPEELPLALWVLADRLGSIPPLIDAALVQRHRAVVLQERAFRDVDAPYGLVHELLYSRLFGAPHPLHGGVGGVPAELALATPDEVRSFVADHLTAANATVTLVGRFDPAQAEALIVGSLGTLPPGERKSLRAFGSPPRDLVDSKEELVSRQPGVTLAWRLGQLGYDDAVALKLGAQLLSIHTDGAFGMRIAADLVEQDRDSLFLLELTVPYDEAPGAVQSDAEGFLRQLTGREMPFDLLQTANLALDRVALFNLDSLEGRAQRLTRLELLSGSKINVADDCGRHWMLDPVTVHDTARAVLHAPNVIVHARPARPRPPRGEPQ